MTNANWGLLDGNNALSMFRIGAQMGQQIQDRRAAAERQAQEQQYRQQTMQLRQQELQTTQAKTAREQQMQQVQQMARLLNHAKDEATYQQSLGAARQMGLDVSQVPQNYGDGTWVNQQKMILGAFEKDADNVPGLVRELEAAGYQQGTPEFQTKLRDIIANKYAPPMQAVDITNADGSVERKFIQRPTQGGAAPQQQGGPQAGSVVDGYRFKGGNPNDPSAWEPAGGAPSQGGATFRP